MRSQLPRALLFSTAVLAIVAPRAGAGDVFATVYPTSSTSLLAIPTTQSYFVPTSYAYTSYSYSPTVYSATSLSPTSYYVPTSSYSYVSRYVNPRRAARMGFYTPTTYYDYVPTVYSAPLVATSATVTSCVESPPSTMPAAPVNPTGSTQATPIKSTPLPPPTTPGDKPIPEPSLIGKPSGESSGVEVPKDPTPAAPVPAPPNDPITPPPAADPKATSDLGASAAGRAKPYLALKPKAGELTMAPTAPPVLIRGRVSTVADGAPIAKARVVLSNTRFANPRTYTADDLGAFEVPFLPEGDWTLAVEDRDGKALEFGVLTVSGGRVYDDKGRVWSSFNLTR